MEVLIEPRGHDQLEIDATGNSIKIGVHAIDATSLERISRCEASEVHARGIHPPMDCLSVWEHGTKVVTSSGRLAGTQFLTTALQISLRGAHRVLGAAGNGDLEDGPVRVARVLDRFAR